MHPHAALLLLSASLGVALSVPAHARQDDCASGVHIILARGTNEVQGASAMEETADAVIAALPGSDREEIVYPATFDLFSQRYGYDATVERINEYTGQCPDTKLVLMGFSQGGWIMTDVACGKASVSLPGRKRSLSASAISGRDPGANFQNVIAVITHGDPTHAIPNESWNAGTSKKSGITPRQNAGDCPGDVMRAYCDDNDQFCDSGTSLAVHFGYNPKYKADTAAFVQSQLGQ